VLEVEAAAAACLLGKGEGHEVHGPSMRLVRHIIHRNLSLTGIFPLAPEPGPIHKML
jgi:hypothetical protein